MKTLIIEGNGNDLEVLCQHIEKMGITPIAAGTGAAGIDLFLSERPDLILLDIALADIDGFEVACRIRQLEQAGERSPIVFLTALNSDEDLENIVAAGGDDYLSKPVSNAALRAKIRSMQRVVQMRQSLMVLTHKLDAANHELKRLAALDGLTGIANRRHFDEALEREWRRATRQGSKLSILMCDIDFFRQYNDAFGHQAGDDCLRQVAAALAAAMDRGGDLIARYGGEEFAVILTETAAGGALFVAERMRQAVEQLNLSNPGSPCGYITASFGVASATPVPAHTPPDWIQAEAGTIPESGATKLLKAGDRVLREAKRQGRNRVCQPPSSDTPSF